MSLEVLGKFLVVVDGILECGVVFGYNFLHAVVGLAPPAVIDAIVVVAGTGNGDLVEIGIGKDGCS